ncbi:MAG: hypothetical protein J5760_07065 [Clostridia bacterium]|nr:hypothetical protein [Clostridia bacterium]
MIVGKSTERRNLRRTAAEIKHYRTLTKILPVMAGFFAMLLIVVYVVTILYNKYGSFTVMVNKYDNVKYGLTLSETREFFDPRMRLNSKASEEITNISINDLPTNLDSDTGGIKHHPGDNWVAYTFFCKNAGELTLDCEYQCYIVNMTKGIEEAVRVRIYRDGVPTDYAWVASDGNPEPGTVAFMTDTDIARGPINDFQPGDITRFTVVIWLEGDDPECVDDILGGQFKIDMSISVVNVFDDAEDK